MVNELASLGLGPSVLQELLEQQNNVGSEQPRLPLLGLSDPPTKSSYPRVVYEFSNTSSSIEPRLRLWIKNSRIESLDSYPSQESLLESTGLTFRHSDHAVRPEDVSSNTQILSLEYVLFFFSSHNSL